MSSGSMREDITRQTIIETIQERRYLILWQTGEDSGLLWNPHAANGEGGVKIVREVHDLRGALAQECREYKSPGMIVRSIDGIAGLMAYRGGEITESDYAIAGTILALKTKDLTDDIIEIHKAMEEKVPNSPLTRQVRDMVAETIDTQKVIEDEVSKLKRKVKH